MDVATLSVGQLQRKAKNTLAREFRGPVWVSGEVKNVRAQRGNTYFTLVEPEDQSNGTDTSVDVAAWTGKSALMHAQLEQAGLRLTAGMNVRVLGEVTLSKFGKLSLILSKLDVEALLGQKEADKKRIVQALRDEGLFELNCRKTAPLVPLRVGLVTSENTEGCNDFLGQLHRSPFSFTVSMVHTAVQGPNAPASIAKAIASLSATDIDVIAVVRGGGGELDAFDKEPVARAICGAAVPVWIGVGHTGDQSVADLVANRSFITPTECGQGFVAAVSEFANELARCTRSLHRSITSQFELRQSNLNEVSHRLLRSSARFVDQSHSQTSEIKNQLRSAVRRTLLNESTRLVTRTSELMRALDRWGNDSRTEIAVLTRQLKALDPKRPLRLGYSITCDETGKVVANANSVSEGTNLVTTLGSGKIHSTTTRTEPT